MRKMPCLFAFENDGVPNKRGVITEQVTEGCEWVLSGEGIATYKWDGTACLLRDQRLFRRRELKGDAKKDIPDGWFPCDDGPKMIHGKQVGWLPIKWDDNGDRVHREAYDAQRFLLGDFPDGTYELIGPSINKNPHRMKNDQFVAHGAPGGGFVADDVPRTFDGLREYLRSLDGEGVVFHHPDGWMCKIRRCDFGFPWPLR